MEYRTLWSRRLEPGTEPVAHGDELLLVPGQPGDGTRRLLQLCLQGGASAVAPGPGPLTPQGDAPATQGQVLLAELPHHLTLEEEEHPQDVSNTGDAVCAVRLGGLSPAPSRPPA